MTIRRFVYLGCLPALFACAHLACFGERSDPNDRQDGTGEPLGKIEAPFDREDQPPSERNVEGAAVPLEPHAVTTVANPALPGGETSPQPVSPTPAVAGTTQSCPSASLLQSVGERGRILVGAMTTDEVANNTPFDMRYMYLAGGIGAGASVCTSCGNCPGGDWWGCWQDPALPPGQYLRDFVAKTTAKGQLPLITYYEFLDASGLPEGTSQIAGARNVETMSRYFNDFRFAVQNLGSSRAFIHLEPDLWGYAQGVNENPALIPAAVATANPTDCAGLPNTFEGFGKCMVSMVRKYAPNTKVGVHASAWGTGTDAMQNRDPSLDVTALARRTADFVLASGGAEADFVTLELSDRDAGWYELQGKVRWFDAQNQTLPHYAQAFSWAKAVTTRMNKPALWWQVPVGNMALPNTHQRYKDNRVDYLFSHMDELADTGAFGVLFGAGLAHQTSPTTDDGYFVSRAAAYLSSAGQPACR